MGKNRFGFLPGHTPNVSKCVKKVNMRIFLCLAIVLDNNEKLSFLSRIDIFKDANSALEMKNLKFQQPKCIYNQFGFFSTLTTFEFSVFSQSHIVINPNRFILNSSSFLSFCFGYFSNMTKCHFLFAYFTEFVNSVISHQCQFAFLPPSQ